MRMGGSSSGVVVVCGAGRLQEEVVVLSVDIVTRLVADLQRKSERSR